MSDSKPHRPSPEKVLLRLKNIHKEYNKDNGNESLSNHIILNKLNLDIKEGEFVTYR